MSFILDALKKSEAERLRKDTPGFADVPDTIREKPSTHWIWILVALVVINVTALAVIFMKPDRVQDTVAAVPAAEPVVIEAVEDPAAASLSEIVERTRPAATPAAMATDPVTRAVIDIASQSADPEPPVARHGSPQFSESYATFNDLRAQGVLQLPDMHLDIHVYSSEPGDRFVFVNMSKYKERATLDEGPVVREITPDGVILDYLGTSFLLPRE
jgi:general secretion pathway protein B